MAKAHSLEVRSLLKEQFDNLEQQREAAALGMWVFLVTEVLFFGGLFMAYITYRSLYPGVFAEGSHHLEAKLGALMTVVLICSSLTMALAVYGAQVGSRKMLVGFLVLTMLLGVAFLGLKFTEYHQKYKDHLIPGPHFSYTGPHARQVELFLSLYFAMTGLHALHMIIGIGVLSVLTFKSLLGRYSPEYHTPVELSGLYWHFVDIIWIFLFPLLYLIDLYSK